MQQRDRQTDGVSKLEQPTKKNRTHAFNLKVNFFDAFLVPTPPARSPHFDVSPSPNSRYITQEKRTQPRILCTLRRVIFLVQMRPMPRESRRSISRNWVAVLYFRGFFNYYFCFRDHQDNSPAVD